MGKERKVYLSFYLEKIHVKDMDEIVADPYNIFDDRSSFIRHCIKETLPAIKSQLKKEKEERERR